MEIRTSLDWNNISTTFIAATHTLPPQFRKDSYRMYVAIEKMIPPLRTMEVEVRCRRKLISEHVAAISEINDAINHLEQWNLLSMLS